jgi:Ser-tRNA(Ala) deacylase AlaX
MLPAARPEGAPEAEVIKLFREDPYRRTAEATVVTVDGDRVALDAALLFAFSGGQQSDRGTVGGHEVLEAEDGTDGTIRYRLPEGHGLAPGDRVEQVVDWETRHRVMRVHSATHAAWAVLSELFGETRRLIGSNVHESKGRLDWELPEPISPLLPRAEERLNEILARDLPVARWAEPSDPDRWLWEVRDDDLDPALWRMPCGGTHVARTGEIGRVKLKRRNIGAGKERVEVTLGG